MAEVANSVRPEKQAVVSELKERLDAAKCAVLVDFKGMSVEHSQDIRTRLREIDAEMFITKNRLLEKALEGRGYAGQWGEMLDGSLALITGRGDPVATAKTVDSFYKEHEVLRVKGGMLDGSGLSVDEVKHLVELPGRDQLYGRLVGTLVAPMRQVAGVLEQKKASIVYVLKAFHDKQEAA